MSNRNKSNRCKYSMIHHCFLHSTQDTISYSTSTHRQHDLVVQDKHFLDLSIRAGGVRFLVHLMVAIQSELIWELLGPRGTVS